MSQVPIINTHAYVIGVGLSPFQKPSQNGLGYVELGKMAVQNALSDSRVRYTEVQQAFVGYCYGDSCQGQRVLYEIGITGIPIVNVNNNCASGSTALYLARQAVLSGQADCVLALGIEEMKESIIGTHFPNQADPLSKHKASLTQSSNQGSSAPFACQIFGNAGIQHMQKYGSKEEHLAKIAAKNHSNASKNPYAQNKKARTTEEVLASKKIYGPLTVLQCCGSSSGGAAAIVCSRKFLEERKELWGQAVEIIGQGVSTDVGEIGGDAGEVAGVAMTRRAVGIASEEVRRRKGRFNVNEVGVVELHDCFSANELVTYEALGLCGEGRAHIDIVDGNGGKNGQRVVVNPSGGLIGKGHPLGATGLAQCAELCWQVRGEAGDRQVEGVKYALQHNIGLGGCAVVTIYEAADKQKLLNRIEELRTTKVKLPAMDPNAFGHWERMMRERKSKL